METDAQGHIDTIHTFWFGELDDLGLSKPEQHGLWFTASDETDMQCRERFGHLVEHALRGGLSAWAESDQGLVALILLLDQFTRNIHRGTPQAFAGDPIALELAQQCISQNRHLHLPVIHQVFLYLPLEHSEDLALQEQSVSLFKALSASTMLSQVESFTRFAIAHRDVIAQFGRFPHRNASLSRTSSPEEIEHIETHGGF